MSEYLTPGKIAKDLDVAPKTVHSWIDSGRLPGIRLPPPGKRRGASRRVAVADYESFKARYGFTSAFTLVIGCSDLPPGTGTISVASVFDAGMILSRRPRMIVVDWSIGLESAADIVKGIRRLPGYTPLLVALSAPDIAEANRLGYSTTISSPRDISSLFDTAEFTHA